MADKINKKVLIKNKRAEFDYFFLTHFTAGIVLTGTEIKSIRQSKVSLVDTFCFITNGEMWIKNMYVAPYFYGSYNNPNSRRDRKLLLNKKEIRKLQTDLKNPGFVSSSKRHFLQNVPKLVSVCSGEAERDLLF